MSGCLVLRALVMLTIAARLTKGSSVCYSHYGCFTSASLSSLVPLPQHPSEIGTRILLYTSSTPDFQSLSDLTSLKVLEQSRFDPKLPTKIVIHGFAAFDSESSVIEVKGWWGIKMKDELLLKEPQNVIIVDWIKGAKFPYHRAVGNTPLVGAQVARFISTMNKLIRRSEANHTPIHIIGFSLGAHIAGFAGRRLRAQGEILDRITGLDPATWRFKDTHVNGRLDPSDAQFVDVIHSSYMLGITAPQGHRDFYPNGGEFQAGCNVLNGLCSHIRSALIFTESIRSACPWRSYRCTSKDEFDRGRCLSCDTGCPRFGYDADKNEHLGQGEFYLYTASHSPFCVYHYLVTIHTSSTWFSGINAHIYIVLFGTKGSSGTIKLAKRDINRGTEEGFVAKSPLDLGELRGISIWHKHVIEAWKVDKIKVRPGWKHFTYSACFHEWIHYEDRTTKPLHVGNLSC